MNEIENPPMFRIKNLQNELIVMNEGKIVQEGTHQVLINKDGLYKSMWEREKAKEQIQLED